MAPRRPVKRLPIVLILASLAFAAGAQDNSRLPDLGSSADALISPQEAQDYGASMLRQMRALDMVVDDPLLDEYINDLGFRLVAACAKPRDHFQFFIVKDEEINAFALPGGYIAVNSGLIAITRNEDELAGVLAHEIGHITQNHLQRAFEDSKKDAPLLALVVLGAIAAGAAGRSAGDAPIAVLAGGQGLLAQKEINFTRKDEIEADRAGIKTLANAGFDPNAMAAFFQHMEDVMSTGAGGQVPSFLQDHPVTSDRIADAKSRADALVTAQKLHPGGDNLLDGQWEQITTPIAFVRGPIRLGADTASPGGLNTYELMRERARVLSGNPVRLVDYYAGNLKNKAGFDTPVNRYGYALALTRSDRGAQAAAQLEPLLKAHAGSLILSLALADARLQAGQRDAALALYQPLNRQSPRNRAVALAYANALTDRGDKQQASTAADLLRPLLENSDDPALYTAYARASDKAGDGERAGEAWADASYYAGRPFDAMEQLQRLLKRNDLSYYSRSRIQARIAELTPLVLELRKRRIDTPDNPATGNSSQQ
ncbi:M48 family metallopeptidase [Rhodanobacter sp. 7MK24]|uniref:beta-barrel assembly-enhancing protease n=1 Tax=Rhodanobacter sp. 7MK24 TaxID=2775922 RepID=UPI00177E0E72|nr:M48 family metalloprotease [Rhodanobacter sp. 7MK24]MBD8879258.1 M48 family metallopeptidase [Rhodanobacter sp. 7MK24]